jgi:hypothetical protein
MARLGDNHQKEKDFREYLLGMREPVNYCCEGCDRVDAKDKTLCSVYIDPDKMWIRGKCLLSTHIKTEAELKKERVRVGQQKQKKKTRA